MSGWREFWLKIFWYGGSTFDAWLNIASAKIASRILTIPQSVAQMGLPSAIVFALAQGAIGLWTQCVFSNLYLKYMRSTGKVGKRDRAAAPVIKHTTQPHEVIGGLLGKGWMLVSLLLHLCTGFYVSFVQFLGCANVVYLLSDKLDKRQWTFVFSGVLSLSVLIPSAHNYRVWSFIGVITLVFVSVHMTASSLTLEKTVDATYSSPQTYTEYFYGLSGLIIIGHVPIPIELMDAMWKPEEYKVASAYSILYILLVTMLPGISMYLSFGDELLTKTNALDMLPSSVFRNTSIVLLLIHVVIIFGMYSLSLYALWEKLLRVHDSPSYVKRTVARVPVFLALLVAALAFPFFGIVNRLLHSVLLTWSLYIFPCLAYNVVIWGGDMDVESISGLGWVADFSVNVGIIMWVVIVECGLGIWGNVEVFVKIKSLKLFDNCFNCL